MGNTGRCERSADFFFLSPEKSNTKPDKRRQNPSEVQIKQRKRMSGKCDDGFQMYGQTAFRPAELLKKSKMEAAQEQMVTQT